MTKKKDRNIECISIIKQFNTNLTKKKHKKQSNFLKK
jgi:hypothetical protein